LVTAEMDPERKVLLDAKLTNNSKTDSSGARGAVRWSSGAMYWVQAIMQALSFLSCGKQTMIRSFFVGINEANRSWKMILTLLAANVRLSLPVIVPIFLLVFGASRRTLAADRLMADKLDAVWLTDVVNHQFPGFTIESVVSQVGALFVVAGV